MDGQTGGERERQTEGQMDGWTDRETHTHRGKGAGQTVSSSQSHERGTGAPYTLYRINTTRL